MRFLSFLRPGDRIGVAAKRSSGWADLSALRGPQTTLDALLDEGLELDALKQAADSAPPLKPPYKPLAPVGSPGKIICIGLNYADHAAESGAAVPEEPVVFNKFPSALCGPEQPIVLPAASREVDYEAELVAVIGRRAHRITEREAAQVVAGYTCGHDVSARDWQLRKPGRQWLLGKTFDTFAPTGPELVTADEIGDPGNLDISLELNGRVMQRSNTQQLIFPVDELVAYVSRICTLDPGDLLFTGTPPGVGFARKPPVYLKPGDRVEVVIEKIGRLGNPVVGEDA